MVVLGDVLMDRVLRVEALPARGGDAPVLAWEERPGGAGLNIACSLARLGVPCVVVSRVGEDEAGRRLVEHLAMSGVDPSFVGTGGATGSVISVVDAGGERTMLSWRGAAAAPPELGRKLEAVLRAAPALVVSGYGLLHPAQAAVYREAALIASEAGAVVALDPGPMAGRIPLQPLQAMLALTDVLMAGARELAELASRLPGRLSPPGPSEPGPVEDSVRRLLEWVPCIAAKLGAEGSILAASAQSGRLPSARLRSALGETDSLWIRHPVRPVAAADTTGAGDAFDAGLLAALLMGLPPDRWLALAHQTAVSLLASRRSSGEAS